MKVIDGKLEPKSETTAEELAFRKALKRVLKEWFDLRLKDLPTIIRKLGIKDENYELILITNIEYIDSYSAHLSVELKRKYTCDYITFSRGQMSNPYPALTVNDKEYYLGRTVTVDELTMPKATKQAEQILKDLMKD